jgi:hypothetical protein
MINKIKVTIVKININVIKFEALVMTDKVDTIF